MHPYRKLSVCEYEPRAALKCKLTVDLLRIVELEMLLFRCGDDEKAERAVVAGRRQ